MIKRNFICLALIILTLHLKAQDSLVKKGYKYDHNFDLSFSTAGKEQALALSWVKFHSVGKKRRFKIGYGIKYTSQFGKNVYYKTAPARLTSNQTGPQVLFIPAHHENIDTFFVSSSQINAFNLSLNLQYTINEKIDIGFSGDAAGFSFGSKKTGTYMAHQSPLNGSSQTASPTTYNLLLVEDNDRGTLNSEFYIRYWFHPKWAIRAGARYLFTEYTTDNKLRLDNDRWRNKSLMALISVTFSPYR